MSGLGLIATRCSLGGPLIFLFEGAWSVFSPAGHAYGVTVRDGVHEVGGMYVVIVWCRESKDV